MSEIDRLAGLLVPPLGEDFRRAQARILQWDPDTYENVIDYEGQRLVNVPVGPSAQVAAMTYQEGDIVLLEGWFPGGRRGELGLGSYWIAGKVTIPGTGAAEQSIAWMQSTLAKQLSVQIIADRFKFASDAGAGTVDTDAWVDLDGADPGPTVTGVEIGPSGKAIVIVTAFMLCPTNARGHMAFTVSGATSFTPGTGFDDTFDFRFRVTEQALGGRFSAVIPMDGLNEGTHTFKAVYRASIGEVAFSARNLLVIAF